MVKFDKEGLIPAIIQEASSGKVLMLGYMNEESLKKTVETGTTWFWSRERQKLWNKGETSGNIQKVKEIRLDCDGDALLILVAQTGVACHTGNLSCFFQNFYTKEPASTFNLETLYDIILSRKLNPVDGSYTCKLFKEGVERISKKVGEESVEVILAGIKGDRDEVIYEVSDLFYHTLVLLASLDISPQEIYSELNRRHKKE
ncbi:MAG TPA: bifunctional phosphoribosyl-AMP cyclohydrolase/phosphoribosyl-ATP diphosphatase HisIE [bacterium]|jgi:phosphoribosyl-ATP pyrophosphohydrolase/phosphoribosyl-AMP cyclohydrolase|nr:bifunctional phosphoribosyl-AMP cyclohydrolase/phosphoribosyl-ATP diphosphatase HisIE [bacterium]HRU33377.1 bifunctional phosphoribosyl-AMP cyclohydrolase/phosphoribosyl-ATP diphosphatase HisIE [bacterium]